MILKIQPLYLQFLTTRTLSGRPRRSASQSHFYSPSPLAFLSFYPRIVSKSALSSLETKPTAAAPQSENRIQCLQKSCILISNSIPVLKCKSRTSLQASADEIRKAKSIPRKIRVLVTKYVSCSGSLMYKASSNLFDFN